MAEPCQLIEIEITNNPTHSVATAAKLAALHEDGWTVDIGDQRLDVAARERFEKCHDVVYVGVREIQRTHEGIEFLVWHATSSIEFDHVGERCDRAIVHVGR